MYRLSSIVATLTALTALGASQSTLAQTTCADIVFIDQVLEAFPEAPSACLDIVERDVLELALPFVQEAALEPELRKRLKAADVEIDRKVLAQLALEDPQTFTAIVEKAKLGAA